MPTIAVERHRDLLRELRARRCSTVAVGHGAGRPDDPLVPRIHHRTPRPGIPGDPVRQPRRRAVDEDRRPAAGRHGAVRPVRSPGSRSRPRTRCRRWQPTRSACSTRSDIPAAHIVGASMGGMIVQTMAIEHPDRVLSLTSIMSTTGHTEVGQPDPESILALLSPAPDRSRREPSTQNVETARVISGDLFDEVESRRSIAAESYDRCFHPAGFAFQIVAIAATGDRTEGLGSVDVPTLVIHGRQDSARHPVGRRSDGGGDSGCRPARVRPDGSRHARAVLAADRRCHLQRRRARRAIADMPDLENDPRLDPRVKWALRNVPVTNLSDVDSRETLIEINQHPKAVALREKTTALYESLDTEEAAPSAGLSITVHEFVSSPDGNTVKVRCRPPGLRRRPTVPLLHPRWRHAERQRLRRDVPDLGQGARRRGPRRGDGRLPQLRDGRRRRPRSSPSRQA